MAVFHLQIVTPDRLIFDGQAEKIIVRTVGGDVCILARHIDYAAPLGIGEARITDAEGNIRVAACSGGMISVSGGEARVMCTTFEWSGPNGQRKRLKKRWPRANARIGNVP